MELKQIEIIEHTRVQNQSGHSKLNSENEMVLFLFTKKEKLKSG